MATTNETTVAVRERSTAGRFDITLNGKVIYPDVIGRPAAESARRLHERMVAQGYFAAEAR
jgi:hypothetical protein